MTESSRARSLDVACERAAGAGGLPEVVGRPRRHPTERRTEPDDAAERRGVAQRAAHVGAVRQRHHPRPQGTRRSPARAAGRAGRVDRVERGAEDRVEGVGAGGELRHVGLPDRDRTSGPDPGHDEVVGVGDVVGEQRRAVRRTPAGDLVGVLERERQPVQRAEGVAPRRRGVRLGRSGPGALLVERHDRVELRVALGDAGQVEVEQLAGGDLPPAYGVRHRAGGRADVDRLIGHIRHTARALLHFQALQRPRSRIAGDPIPTLTAAAGRRGSRRRRRAAPVRRRRRCP